MDTTPPPPGTRGSVIAASAGAISVPATTTEDLLNTQTSRRALLAHAATASAALSSVTSAAKAAPAADPIFALLAERKRLSKAACAADERAVMISRALPPEAFAAPAIPTLDIDSPAARASAAKLRADPAFKRMQQLVDQQIAEEAAQRREQESARLAERERMDKLIAESGYDAAHEERDALEAEGRELGRVIAATPATSMAGAIAKLSAGIEPLIDAAGADLDSLDDHERLIVAALADLERLVAPSTPATAAA